MLHLAIVFLVVALIAAFLRIRRSGSPVVGRGKDTVRYLPHSRRAVFPGAWLQRAVLRRVRGARLTRQWLSHFVWTHTISRRGSIVNNKAAVQPRSNGSTPIRVLMADPDASITAVYREPSRERASKWPRHSAAWSASLGSRAAYRTCSCSNRRCHGAGATESSTMMGEIPPLAVVPVMVLTSCRDPDVWKACLASRSATTRSNRCSPDRLAGRLRSLLDHPRTAFQFGGTNRSSGMFDRPANRRRSPGPARRNR